ncbi:hypothetical protein G6F46_015091 [Rhizopus delemar]|nr:hypothetical protein G6F46_015091 [Rhizopus delemar]
MFGNWVDSPRLSCWIGDPQARYRYSGAEFVPHPWPPVLQALRERLQAAGAQRPPALEETPPLAWPDPAADGAPAAVVRGYMLACHAWEPRARGYPRGLVH